MQGGSGESGMLYSIVHCDVVLRLLDRNRFRVQAELYLIPSTGDFKSIQLNFNPLIKIDQILVNGGQCKNFKLQPVKKSAGNDLHQLLIAEYNHRELIIDCDGINLVKDQETMEYDPIVIWINYDLDLTTGTWMCVQSGEQQLLYFCHGRMKNCRLWIPCIDSQSERYTWNITFHLPQHLIAICSGDSIVLPQDEDNTQDQQSIDRDEHPVTVNGDSDGNTLNQTYKAHRFKIDSNVSVWDISWAIAQFQVVSLKPFMSTSSNLTVDSFVFTTGQSHQVSADLMTRIGKAYEFVGQYIGVSWPFKNWKLCFLPGLAESVHGAGVSFISQDLLYGDRDIIEQVVPTTLSIAYSICYQWFGVYAYATQLRDRWVVEGICGYVAMLHIKAVFGQNEYKYRVCEDMKYVTDNDFERLPCCPKQDVLEFSDDFYRTKASVVMYMLGRNIGRTMLQKVVNRIMISAISGELAEGVSTQMFLRLVKKTSGKDTKLFSDQWIYTAGIPKVESQYYFNRKKNVVEVKIVQQVNKAHPLYNGSLVIRIHEPDGTFDHVVRIEDREHQFNINYHTKYKRLKANKKSLLLAEKLAEEEQEETLELAPPPGCETDEVTNLTDPELSAELSKAKYKETDEESQLGTSPITWIRIDPDMDLCFRVPYEQTEYMNCMQLLKDKDPIAQIEAVQMLVQFPTERAAANLLFALTDVRLFYRVRMQAALSLAHPVQQQLDHIGYRYLMMAFAKKFCIPESGDGDKAMDGDYTQILMPKRNDFSVVTEYYVQKAIVDSMSKIRNVDSGKLLPFICWQLLTLLKSNDNSSNQFSDSMYVATLLKALGQSFMSISDAQDETSAIQAKQHVKLDSELKNLVQDAVAELDRNLFLETQVPTYHNVVACECLSVLYRWLLHGNIVTPEFITLRPFMIFSAPGNFYRVRLVAFEALVTFRLSDQTYWDYIMETLRNKEECDTKLKLGLLQLIYQKFRVLRGSYYRELKDRESQTRKQKAKEEKIKIEVEDIGSNNNAVQELLQQKRQVQEFDQIKALFRNDFIITGMNRIVKECADLQMQIAALRILDVMNVRDEVVLEPIKIKIPLSQKSSVAAEMTPLSATADSLQQSPVQVNKVAAAAPAPTTKPKLTFKLSLGGSTANK
ncbi:hypothetical protein MIR68_002228 [Amoeboaphelidium protococcarum]|nr:hypothetical protein MIR68_002228 [Amoeboaphelidium protococcarum]